MQNLRPKHQLVGESRASIRTGPSLQCFRKASLLNSAFFDYDIYDWLTCLKGWALKKLSLILLDSVAGSAAFISNDLFKHIQCPRYLLVRIQDVLPFHSIFYSTFEASLLDHQEHTCTLLDLVRIASVHPRYAL